MNPSFEQMLVEVWRQALVENAKVVELGKVRYPVRRTPKRGLRQVDFVFDWNEIRQEAAESNEEIREGSTEGGKEGESSLQTYVITPVFHLHHPLSHSCSKSFTVAGACPSLYAGHGLTTVRLFQELWEKW